MTDNNTPVPQGQTVAAPAVVAAPTPAETIITPVQTNTPAASPPEAPQVPEAVAAPKAPATLLGAEPKVETPADVPVDPKVDTPNTDVKPEVEKPAEPKKEEVTQSAEAAPQPTYEPWKLPEGIQADEKGLGELTNLLAEVELAKGDHAKMQEVGQKLVDRHIAELQTVLKKQGEFYLDAFEKQKTEWKSAVEKDPELGGNRIDTTLKAANEFIRTHGGNDVQQKEFRDLMESTGIGNHPAMIRLLAKANLAMREGKPVPATTPITQPSSKVEKRYGKIV